MNLAIIDSVAGVPIRLTDERWEHIIEARPYLRNHLDDVLDTVENPMVLLRAHGGALAAVRSLGRKRYLHVLYREVSRKDGFIITAYFKDSYNRRLIIWRADEQ